MHTKLRGTGYAFWQNAVLRLEACEGWITLVYIVNSLVSGSPYLYSYKNKLMFITILDKRKYQFISISTSTVKDGWSQLK